MATVPTPKEIREAFSDYSQATAHIRDEGKIDMRYVAGDPWDPRDRLAREDAHRPCMSFDQINQYLNQWKAQIRMNKRAVELSPESEDADPKDAEKRANMIRGIEYRSRAQQAYITAGDNMIMRSAGYARISMRPVGGKSFDKELCLKPVLNPDTIIYSPSYRMPDGSDVEEVFEIDFLSHDAFKRRFPKAKIQSFTGEHMGEARNWIRDDDVQLAGYWKAHIEYKNLLLIEGMDEPVWEDDLKDAMGARGKNGKFAKLRDRVKILREERQETRRVVQYLTNGIEILDTVDWPGTRIPIPACFGKELFMDLGSGPKRHLYSMVRLARDPQMFHAYAISQEAEEFGQAPKAPFAGFKGQFESDADAIANSNKLPTAMLQFDVPPDWNQQWGPPPLPSRPQFQPNIASFEQAKESSRMSIQSAMGIMPQATDIQKVDDKSGIAMERVQRLEAIGSMDYTENFDRFIENVGWQLNELLGPVYDTDRHVPVVKPDGKQGLMRINPENPEQAQPYAVQGMPDEAPPPAQGQPNNEDQETLNTGEGQFGVTITVGPSHDSEREEVAEFVDGLLEHLQVLPIPPEVGKMILAKAIRMRGIGAVGDEIADLLDPPNEANLPPEAQAALANMKAQISQLAQENQALLMDKAGKTQETRAKLQIEHAKQQGMILQKQWDYITRVVVAELAKGSKADEIQARLAADKELSMLGFSQDQQLAQHQAAHEVGLQASQPPPPMPAPPNGADTAPAQ